MQRRFTGFNIFLLGASIYLGQWLRKNPMLFGQSLGEANLPSNVTFPIYTSHSALDAVLEYHRSDIGESDYDKYRNHCLRTLSFAAYYLRRYPQYATADGIPSQVMNVVAMAIGYHDIGLWTKGALNYLEPSVTTMLEDFADTNNAGPPGMPTTFTEADMETARYIITEHHKYSMWTAATEEEEEKGKEEQSSDASSSSTISTLVNEAAVNAVRKADWADFTMGVIKNGMPSSYVEKAYTVHPEAGFHYMLMGMGSRLSPSSILGQLEVLKIFKR
jgi:hypothetical protein